MIPPRLARGSLFVPLLLSVSAFAADKPPACTAAEHRQFDFWIGSWNVMEKGKLAGHNRITAIDGGCVLLESWTGASGFTGHSLNIYDASRGKWHQTWVDNSGSLLVLEGTFRDGKMVLEGDHEVPGAKKGRRERITWTPLPGGELRQHWESSTDGGATWTTAFDGHYKRAPENSAPAK
jgi:hypothetical protein